LSTSTFIRGSGVRERKRKRETGKEERGEEKRERERRGEKQRPACGERRTLALEDALARGG